jgi:hypothetical protein
MAAVPSVDPSLMMMNSKSLKVWFKILDTDSRKKRSPLKTLITTEMTGLSICKYSTTIPRHTV